MPLRSRDTGGMTASSSLRQVVVESPSWAEFIGTLQKTRTFQTNYSIVAGQRHDTAKRLSLQEVSRNPFYNRCPGYAGSQNHLVVVSPETYSNSVKEYDNELLKPK